MEAGELPEDLLAENLTAWTTTQGDLDGAVYRHAIQLMARMTNATMRFSVLAITVQDNRVLIETSSTATLLDGSDYANNYVFSLRLDGNRIAHVREHFNALVVREKLMPILAKIQQS